MNIPSSIIKIYIYFFAFLLIKSLKVTVIAPKIIPNKTDENINIITRESFKFVI